MATQLPKAAKAPSPLTKLKLGLRVDRWARAEFFTQLGRMRAYGLTGNRIHRKSRFVPGVETVLLTQGFVQTRGVFTAMEKRLRRDGYQVFSINLGGFLGVYNTGRIEDVSHMLLDKLARFRARYQLPRIHMVGHSMGGLVGRYMIQALGASEHLKTLITLGTPHQGTPTAYVAAIPPMSFVLGTGRQMLPGGDFIESLNRRALPEEVKMVSIFSRRDMVCPYYCSELVGRPGERVRNLMVDGPGHSGLLLSPRVYRLVRGELRPPTPV